MLTHASVLHPADDPFDRADIKPAADATDRLAFPSATPVSKLPFSVISYAGETETYTTPELLRTLQAIDVDALATATATATATSDAGESTSTPTADVTPVVNGANTKAVAGGAGLFAVLAAMMMV
ncbi:transforming growth factor-beta-induced ig-h3 [Fusarium longipes]|uniref:Transforming growth factor-beta-induced ig-h3 n=1 Tax=Fusarium longipes TaxID=694270 RepID=A0A395SIV7_9HYPO|nr:transforming growth factor-beta-induced ig-h3 [Fusarium longipes]